MTAKTRSVRGGLQATEEHLARNSGTPTSPQRLVAKQVNAAKAALTRSGSHPFLFSQKSETGKHKAAVTIEDWELNVNCVINLKSQGVGRQRLEALKQMP